MMNPYHFNNPAVRAIAFDLAKALADFDANATAALVSAEQRMAALETTTGGSHEVAETSLPNPNGLVSLNAAPAHPTFMMRLEQLRQIPLAKVPLQDVDASADHYSHGLSGRCA